MVMKFSRNKKAPGACQPRAAQAGCRDSAPDSCRGDTTPPPPPEQPAAADDRRCLRCRRSLLVRAAIRGLCRACYERASRAVKRKETTWDDLVAAGACLPAIGVNSGNCAAHARVF